ncbi:MAG: hypothetical protein FWF46_06510 [Oscillospiraceae bacterium]|nr:hypothetical protein [Oscillospiraceae bacterium]
MLNILWPIFIIISIVYAIIVGRIDELNSSIFKSAEDTISLCITFLGTICLWNGIMNIAQTSTLIEKLTKLLSPIMKFLFPEIKKEEKAYKEISMNMVANMLGLGNAATPLGLKAMDSMQEKNPDKTRLSNSMTTLIVINTASLQIIPTTIIAIRTSLNSQNPTSIIVPVWITSIATFLTVVVLNKVLSKRF